MFDANSHRLPQTPNRKRHTTPFKEAPTFRPTAEEAKDALAFIKKIRKEAEQFGICKIVLPQGVGTFGLNPNIEFSTRTQKPNYTNTATRPQIDYMDSVYQYHNQTDTPITAHPTIQEKPVNFYELNMLVQAEGGYEAVSEEDPEAWKRIGEILELPPKKIQQVYEKYILPYEQYIYDKDMTIDYCDDCPDAGPQCPHCICSTKPFGFGVGKTHTLESFEAQSRDFISNYKDMGNKNGTWNVGDAEIEAEFWNLSRDLYSEMEVEYGADIDGLQWGSAFPTHEQYPNDPASNSSWNLTKLPILEKSLLHTLPRISGMTVPWVYLGGPFSHFCFHTEDHDLFSINYMHLGGTKTWYSVPSRCYDALHKNWAGDHDLTSLLDVDQLKQHVDVYRVEQHWGEYVVTFPRAYHAGFNHAFNVAEAVNFALPSWIPNGARAIARYKKEKKKSPVFCHESLVLRYASLDKLHEIHKMEDIVAWIKPALETILVTQLKRLNSLSEIFTTLATVKSIDREEFQCAHCNSLSGMLIIRCPCGLYCEEHAPNCKNQCNAEARVLLLGWTGKEIVDIITKFEKQCDVNVEPAR